MSDIKEGRNFINKLLVREIKGKVYEERNDDLSTIAHYCQVLSLHLVMKEAVVFLGAEVLYDTGLDDAKCVEELRLGSVHNAINILIEKKLLRAVITENPFSFIVQAEPSDNNKDPTRIINLNGSIAVSYCYTCRREFHNYKDQPGKPGICSSTPGGRGRCRDRCRGRIGKKYPSCFAKDEFEMGKAKAEINKCRIIIFIGTNLVNARTARLFKYAFKLGKPIYIMNSTETKFDDLLDNRLYGHVGELTNMLMRYMGEGEPVPQEPEDDEGYGVAPRQEPEDDGEYGVAPRQEPEDDGEYGVAPRQEPEDDGEYGVAPPQEPEVDYGRGDPRPEYHLRESPPPPPFPRNNHYKLEVVLDDVVQNNEQEPMEEDETKEEAEEEEEENAPGPAPPAEPFRQIKEEPMEETTEDEVVGKQDQVKQEDPQVAPLDKVKIENIEENEQQVEQRNEQNQPDELDVKPNVNEDIVENHQDMDFPRMNEFIEPHQPIGNPVNAAIPEQQHNQNVNAYHYGFDQFQEHQHVTFAQSADTYNPQQQPNALPSFEFRPAMGEGGNPMNYGPPQNYYGGHFAQNYPNEPQHFVEHNTHFHRGDETFEARIDVEPAPSTQQDRELSQVAGISLQIQRERHTLDEQNLTQEETGSDLETGNSFRQDDGTRGDEQQPQENSPSFSETSSSTETQDEPFARVVSGIVEAVHEEHQMQQQYQGPKQNAQAPQLNRDDFDEELEQILENIPEDMLAIGVYPANQEDQIMEVDQQQNTNM